MPGKWVMVPAAKKTRLPVRLARLHGVRTREEQALRFRARLLPTFACPAFSSDTLFATATLLPQPYSSTRVYSTSPDQSVVCFRPTCNIHVVYTYRKHSSNLLVRPYSLNKKLRTGEQHAGVCHWRCTPQYQPSVVIDLKKYVTLQTYRTKPFFCEHVESTVRTTTCSVYRTEN